MGEGGRNNTWKQKFYTLIKTRVLIGTIIGFFLHCTNFWRDKVGPQRTRLFSLFMVTDGCEITEDHELMRTKEVIQLEVG